MRHLLVLLCLATARAQSADEVHVVELDGRLISYTIQAGFAVTQGDIILGRAEEMENFRKAQAGGQRAARPRSVYVPGANNARLWPNATIYYTMEADVPVQQNLLSAIDYWNTIAPFKILPRTAEPNYVTFRRIVVDAACSSSVGMVGGQQFVGVTSLCSVGAAIHELGHAFGLLHEQERADRDAFVTVLFENIDKRFWSNFYQSTNSVDKGYYDYDSIEHYSVTGFGRNFGDTISTVPPGIPIGQRAGLSAGDVDAITRIYGVVPTQTTITTTPSGLQVTVDGQTVTTPAKFDWPPGSTHSVSVPPLQGTAPRYAFVRWSDGGAAEHTISASADVTVYCAQFQRQFQTRAAVGAGAGTATIVPSPADGYLADRQTFALRATPDADNRFVRWTGTTFLGSAGSSVSAASPLLQVFGGASNYLASFTTSPLHVVDSQPRGAQVVVDNVSYFTPVSFAWAPGSTHTMSASESQMRGNNTHRFTFLGWEDGSDGARTVTATADGTMFTARFREEFLLSRSTVGPGTVRVAPASSDGFYESGTTVTLTAAPAAGQSLRYWVGDLAGVNPEQMLVMDQQRAVLANFGSPFSWLLLHAGSLALNATPGTTGMAVAPGEIVSIFGANIGPAVGQSTRPGADGRLPTSVEGFSVTFDQLAAPITYAGQNQLNVVVPYGLAGRTTTTVTVRRPAGNLANSVSVSPTFPGIFTANGTGMGPVAALNEDGSINSQSNPAPPGSVVVLYGTGAGVLERSFADGEVMPAQLVSPAARVLVRFDKLSGQVQYAGAAPLLVNGALQVNVVVPPEVVGGGQVPVRLIAGGYSSPPGTTIWIR
jgi:astacin